MRRRRKDLTKIDDAIAEGRGQGFGAAYRPWLTVRDVPSLGVSSRVRGRLTDRVHHLLSNLERDVFRFLEWDPRTIDLREQFPLLPLAETQILAEHLRVRHPAVRGESCVMTTDFVVSRQTGDGTSTHAIAVKTASELGKSRVLEKLAIEASYWMRRGVDWVVWTEEQLPRDLCANLRLLAPYRSPERFRRDDPEREQLLGALRRWLASVPREPLALRCLEHDTHMQWPRGESLAGVFHAIARRHWRVDLSRRINTLAPVNLLINGDAW